MNDLDALAKAVRERLEKKRGPKAPLPPPKPPKQRRGAKKRQ